MPKGHSRVQDQIRKEIGTKLLKGRTGSDLVATAKKSERLFWSLKTSKKKGLCPKPKGGTNSKRSDLRHRYDAITEGKRENAIKKEKKGNGQPTSGAIELRQMTFKQGPWDLLTTLDGTS